MRGPAQWGENPEGWKISNFQLPVTFTAETGISNPAHPNPRPTQTHWVKGGFWVISGFHGWADKSWHIYDSRYCLLEYGVPCSGTTDYGSTATDYWVWVGLGRPAINQSIGCGFWLGLGWQFHEYRFTWVPMGCMFSEIPVSGVYHCFSRVFCSISGSVYTAKKFRTSIQVAKFPTESWGTIRRCFFDLVLWHVYSIY